jgi:hypothetical protein
MAERFQRQRPALHGAGRSAVPHDRLGWCGGAIVTWEDFRSGTSNGDIYAQRVNLAGGPQWTTDGVALCTAANNQYNPTIASDGAGGAIVTWSDGRSGSQLRHLRATGERAGRAAAGYGKGGAKGSLQVLEELA